MEKGKCYLGCTCDNPVFGSTYYECNYGGCCGYKCETCGGWQYPQWGVACSQRVVPKAETPEGELEIALQEAETLKDTLKRRNRQIRDLRRQFRK